MVAALHVGVVQLPVHAAGGVHGPVTAERPTAAQKLPYGHGMPADMP
jgi:hypothetical protein